MSNNFEDCHVGKKMDLNVAKMQKDIEYIKIDQRETKDTIKKLDEKFDKFIDSIDKKYARKDELSDLKDKINWAITTSITLLFSISAFLINYIFF